MKMKLGGLFRSGGQLGRAVQWYRSISAPDSEEEARIRFQLAETGGFLFVRGGIRRRAFLGARFAPDEPMRARHTGGSPKKR